MMHLSDNGMADIAFREGIVVAPYLSGLPGDPWTCGIGHTAAAGDPDPAAMPRAMPGDIDAAIRDAIRQFRTDLIDYEVRINQHVTAPMTQNEFDAFVSVDLNTGWAWYRAPSGAYRSATAIQLFNAGDKSGCANAFLNWCSPPAIRGRRQQEQELFLSGTYLSAPIAVYGTDGAGKLDTRPIRSLSRADFLSMASAG